MFTNISLTQVYINVNFTVFIFMSDSTFPPELSHPETRAAKVCQDVLFKNLLSKSATDPPGKTCPNALLQPFDVSPAVCCVM